MATTTKKRSRAESSVPYGHNTNIVVYYEMKHGKDEVSVGTPLRFKFQRGTFKFIKLVHNTEKNVTWIDCLDQVNGTFRSFYVDQLKNVVKPKKTRKAKSGV